MFTTERHEDMILKLKQEGKVKVKQLSEIYQVSEDCIRKDLKMIEKQGKCKRVYGGATYLDKNQDRNVFQRKNVDYVDKQEIANKVVAIIQEGETIFLDVSTTNLIVAKRLAQSQKRCIVISNMLEILLILAKNPLINVIGTGGNVNLELSGFVGAATLNVINKHSFDRCFIGTTGIDFDTMKITTFDFDDGLVKECVLQNSKQCYLLMEKSKFSMMGNYKFADIAQIDCILTNQKIPKSYKDTLKKAHIRFQ